MQKLYFLQLNELKFDYIDAYIADGLLPNFAKAFERHGYCHTVSEKRHELANPWIQWPTVHTGLDYEDHGVFRLGDIVRAGHTQIYELLEKKDISVAALSPFNASNNTQASKFFVPDPWTKTKFDGSNDLRRLYDALVQVTDDYASGRITFRSLVNLALGSAPNLDPQLVPDTVEAVREYALGKKWWRAVVCDNVLAGAFVRHCRVDDPDFATVFLNGGAHLQHHYLYSSRAYDGPNRNPTWHVPADADPLLNILQAYDRILGRFMEFADGNRLIIATGLSQEPHERVTYYYRIDDQADFLDRIGISYDETYRLMTEDFVVRFPDAAAAKAAEEKLAAVKTVECEDIFYVETGDSAVRTEKTGPNIFHIENRGDSLYLQLRPTNQEFVKNMRVMSGNDIVEDFNSRVSFAQFKNTHHIGKGYYLDTAYERGELPDEFPLREIFDVVLRHFDIDAAAELKRPVPAWIHGPRASAA